MGQARKGIVVCFGAVMMMMVMMLNIEARVYSGILLDIREADDAVPSLGFGGGFYMHDFECGGV
jgi:hypothetical protein